MTPELAVELRKYPAAIGEEHLFPPKRGSKGERQGVEGSFETILELAGIQNFRFHDLRHTFASWYMMNGGDLYELAKILGRANIKITAEDGTRFFRASVPAAWRSTAPAPPADYLALVRKFSCALRLYDRTHNSMRG